MKNFRANEGDGCRDVEDRQGAATVEGVVTDGFDGWWDGDARDGATGEGVRLDGGDRTTDPDVPRTARAAEPVQRHAVGR